MQRRKARELCLQILFQHEFSKELNIDKSVDYFKQHHHIDNTSSEYASLLLKGVIVLKSKIDSLINDSSKNWKTSRMSSVDLNILRMSIYEAVLLDPPNEPKVVINESLEIAKKYSSADSATFINGVLDQVFHLQLGNFNT